MAVSVMLVGEERTAAKVIKSLIQSHVRKNANTCFCSSIHIRNLINFHQHQPLMVSYGLIKCGIFPTRVGLLVIPLHLYMLFFFFFICVIFCLNVYVCSHIV